MKAIEAFELAAEMNKTLLATDPRLRRAVKIIHDEGTVLFFDYAFAENHEDWVFIFTEHHGHHVYHESDVLVYQYERIYDDEEV